MEGDFDVVVPEDSKGFEPFHAVYRRLSCLESARRNIKAAQESPASRKGGASMKSVVLDPELRLCRFSMDEVRASCQRRVLRQLQHSRGACRAEERIFGGEAK